MPKYVDNPQNRRLGRVGKKYSRSRRRRPALKATYTLSPSKDDIFRSKFYPSSNNIFKTLTPKHTFPIKSGTNVYNSFDSNPPIPEIQIIDCDTAITEKLCTSILHSGGVNRCIWNPTSQRCSFANVEGDFFPVKKEEYY